MTFVQPGWNWYVAQLVVESRVEHMREPIILIESVLLHAESPGAAYVKAESLCASGEHVYRNKAGQKVTQQHVGIHDLDNLQTEQPHDGLVLGVRLVPGESGNHVRSRAESALFGGERPEWSSLNQ